MHTQGLVHLELAQVVTVAPAATWCCSFCVNFLTVLFLNTSFLFLFSIIGEFKSEEKYLVCK